MATRGGLSGARHVLIVSQNPCKNNKAGLKSPALPFKPSLMRCEGLRRFCRLRLMAAGLPNERPFLPRLTNANANPVRGLLFRGELRSSIFGLCHARLQGRHAKNSSFINH